MSIQKVISTIEKILTKLVTIVVALVILLPSLAGSAMAEQAKSIAGMKVAGAPSSQRGPTDRAELEAFLDSLLTKQFQENHIAGAAVSVVKDGKLFFAKGYGYADVAKGIPVDPESTLFHIGSVGKLLTWTAVMQLVEQGKLNLDANINTYLDFRIPDTFVQPITLKHLLTHTSGFEDVLLESVVSDPNYLVPPREWLVSHMAARVRPPGEAAGYSNYNAMLAGYIVARVAGQPYDQYIQDHIFTPLGMAHSTASSVTPPELWKYASTGYTYQDSALHVYPEYMAQPALMPSGGQQASVNDMARFMIAHLQGGSYSDATVGEARILKETTARQMQSTLYTPDPRLGGTAYGFFDLSDNGEQTLGSEGYFPPMHSQLLLLPAQNLGVFVTYNSTGADGLTVQHIGFQRAFFDHYYPASEVEPLKPAADSAQQVSRFVGVYKYSSSPATTLIKVIELFGGYLLEISNPGDGTLLLNLSGIKFRFVQVEPLYFRQVDSPFHMLFREDQNGRITQMYTDFMPQYTSVKLDWYETPGFSTTLVMVCLLVFLSVIPVVLVRAIRGRRHGGDGKPATRGTTAAQWILLSLCVLNLLFVVGVMLWGQPPTELGDISLMAKVVLGLGVVSAVLTVGALVYAAQAWKNSYWNIAGRVYYTVITGAAVAFVWFLNSWNMLGWRF